MKSINIRFPLHDDNSKNTFFKLNQITKDAFSSDLLFLLLTEKGERYYNPEFGTFLLKFVFEPNDSLTAQDVEEDIKQTVSRFIPKLKITRVSFVNSENNESQLNVNIKFTYSEDTFSEDGELDINF